MKKLIYFISLLILVGFASCVNNQEVDQVNEYTDTEWYNPETQEVTQHRVEGIPVDINGKPIDEEKILQDLKVKYDEMESRSVCGCNINVFDVVVGYINGESHLKMYYMVSNNPAPAPHNPALNYRTTFHGTVEGLYPNSCSFISFVRTYYHPLQHEVYCQSPGQSPWWRFAPAGFTIPCNLEPVRVWVTGRYTGYDAPNGTEFLCGDDTVDMTWLTQAQCPCVWWL